MDCVGIDFRRINRGKRGDSNSLTFSAHEPESCVSTNSTTRSWLPVDTF